MITAVANILAAPLKLLGHLGQSVNFEQFQLGLSIQYLAMIVIGGLEGLFAYTPKRGFADHRAAAAAWLRSPVGASRHDANARPTALTSSRSSGRPDGAAK